MSAVGVSPLYKAYEVICYHDLVLAYLADKGNKFAQRLLEQRDITVEEVKQYVTERDILAKDCNSHHPLWGHSVNVDETE